MGRICTLKGCYKKHRCLGFCARHYYLFVDKQRMELTNKKNPKDYSSLKEEYTPVKFKVDSSF